MAPTPPPRARLIRRAPLSARIKAYLNPADLLLWLSEELNGNEWDEFWNQWATPAGILLNLVFMVARANAATAAGARGDDVFGDYYERSGSGWLSWLASFVVYFLSLLGCLNAAYAFLRRRHYRLFEASVDVPPSTPSARRVRVDSSPLSSSPLQYLSNILAASTAQARAHPDAARDVWEVAVWDPTPLCLRIFCLFSPGHVLVYWLFLPLTPLDPRPSVTVVTAIVLVTLLSVQLLVLQHFFSQQVKDSALIYKEVQHEYDTKFVHPALYKPVRDVGTQILSSRNSGQLNEVNTYTPTTFVNRGFHPNPNPNYAAHFDPDGTTTPRPANQAQRVSRSVTTPAFHATTPASDFSSPLRSAAPSALRQPQFRSSAAGPSAGDGGSFGIYSHAQSPLKRPQPASGQRPSLGANDAVRQRPQFRREGSPLKRSSLPGDGRINGVPSPAPRFANRDGDWT